MRIWIGLHNGFSITTGEVIDKGVVLFDGEIRGRIVGSSRIHAVLEL